MRFKYIASQLDGRILEGELDAKNKSEVLSFLSASSLRPVSVKPLSDARNWKISLFGGRIDLTDQIFLSKNLALMLKIGIGLLQAINILIDDFEKKAMKALLLEIRSGVEKGQPFYLTFARYPKVFSQAYTNLIKAGESSGNLETVFENLSVSLTKEKTLRDQIKSVLVYPIILLATSVLILVFLVGFAIPKIAKLFLESGFNPPLFSKIVFGVGLFFGKFGFYIL
ncbi:MAG: type II secretion system F family protein, partial [Patescibacteria group bacterium]